MAKFTLLEINLDGAQLTANAPFSDGSEHPDAIPGGGDGTDAAVDGEDSGRSRTWLAALVGLLFLAVLAVLVNRRRGGATEADPDVDIEAQAGDR